MLIAYCSVSCDKHLPVIEDGAVESVSISLRNVGSVSTKSVSHTAEESAVSTLDVFVFRDGALEAHGRVSGASSVSGLKVSHGAKTVWAFANFSTERMNAIGSLSDAVSLASQYGENSRTSFVMRGSKNITVSSSETSFTMSVTRDVSKVIIDAAPVFTGTASGGTLEGIYLINVPKTFDEDAVLTSSDGANAWNFDNTVASSPDGSACSYATGSSSWSSALYGMPNASPEAADADTKDYVTKCVLKATVQGQTYWYPVGIPDMQANKCYSISNIVINRPGSDAPNSYLTEESLSVSITVSPWDEGEMTGHYNDGIYAAPRGYHMGHEWVDLGLRETIDGVVYKVLFATCNIGASSPYEDGDYFAWAETEKRYSGFYPDGTIVNFNDTHSFKIINAPYHTGSTLTSGWSKYVPTGKESYSVSGTADNLLTLEASDDVASVMWGGNWRMPDSSELEFLISSSVDYDYYTYEGVPGLRVTGKGDFASSSVFLSAAGACEGNELNNKNFQGRYWSKVLYSNVPSEAYHLFFSAHEFVLEDFVRYYGCSVRPVYVVPDHTNPMNIAANGHDYVDLGLRKNGKKILFATMNVGASSETDYGDYFAWGETSKRYTSISGNTITGGDPFDWAYAPYHTGSTYDTGWTKYIPTGMESYTVSGIADNKLILESSDDVASVMWGGSWRMPDSSELEYLLGSSVDSEWVTDYNGSGINGFKFTGKGEFSSSVLFLPTAGNCDGWECNSAGDNAYYWSRGVDPSVPYIAYCLNFVFYCIDSINRYYGEPVRPVLEVDE